MKSKNIIITIVVVIAVLAVVFAAYGFLNSETKATEVEKEWANEFVNTQFDAMAKTEPAKLIAEENTIVVNSVSYGEERDIILECSVETIDAYSALSGEYDRFLSADGKKGARFKTKTEFKNEFKDGVLELLNTAEAKTDNVTITLYETKDEGIVVYASDEVVNAVYGGIVDVIDEVSAMTTYTRTNADGSTEEVEIAAANIVKGYVEGISPIYNDDKPDTSSVIIKFINRQKKDFHQNFIKDDGWIRILKGLWTTVQITFFALIIGVVLGFVAAFIRCAHMKVKKRGILLNIANAICQVYLTVIRGTPVMVQIMIIHFVFLQPMGVNSFVSAFICFGINSGAYVAEIVRGGIMSIDEGQTEAGRSLGFNYIQTMWYIILPQAFKAVLPSLANEFVVLLKETSVAFYIGVADMMYEIVAIRSVTYSAYMPLLAAAAIYLVLVLTFSKLVNILEGRLRNSER